MARATGGLPEEIDEMATRIQDELFALGAQLATPDPSAHKTSLVGAERVAALEVAIDHYDSLLQPLQQFILPIGTPAAATLHFARTVCRRAERRVVALAKSANPPLDPDLAVYLNRLSDLLFVLARTVNRLAGEPDVSWRKPTV